MSMVENWCSPYLREGLISDMILTRIPILIGDRLPLFGALEHDIDFEHLETRSFASGLVTSHYRLVGAGNERVSAR